MLKYPLGENTKMPSVLIVLNLTPMVNLTLPDKTITVVLDFHEYLCSNAFD